MRVLFACLPGTGHFLPLIPLARAAAAAGHEVVVTSGTRIAGAVRAAGLPFEEAGPPSIESVAATIPELQSLQGRARADGMWSHAFSGPMAAGLAEGILDVAGRWSPDVIVREDTALGAIVAADRLDLPMATVQITAWRPRLLPLAAPNVSRLRAAHGLDPDPELARAYRDLLLVARPSTLIPPDAPLPPTARPMRPVAADDGSDAAIPTWLANGTQRSRPRVAVTLGTVNNDRTDIVRPILDGLADNADACVSAGVAIAIPPAELTPATIRRAVDEVLGDVRYRERAAALAAEIESMPPPEAAIEQVAALAAASRSTA